MNWKLALASACALAALVLSATADSGSSAPAPSQVANAVSEGALATLALTPESEKRLAIAVVRAEKKPFARTRLFAGHVLAPLASGGAIAPITTGASELQLAEAQVAAEGAVAVARARLEGAKRALARAEQMLRDDAGSQREVDDARTEVTVSQAALAAAQQQRALLGSAEAADGGARVWVRVPVHASEASEIDAQREASVGGVSGRANEPSLTALPVRGAPLGRSASPAIDFFYEVKGARALRIGQQVGVALPLRGAADALVVPWSALLYDAEGGSWVYERVAPNTYARRRVQIESVAGAEAAISGAALEGKEIVSAGAAELFGAEFGAGK
jgi:hypothetical protein